MYYGKIYGMRWGTPKTRMSKKALEEFKEFQRLMNEDENAEKKDHDESKEEKPE